MLVDFWTYTCINCIRTLPEVESWYQRYERDGLVVIGVHTPEFPFERDAGNVADAIERNGLTYPVVQDNDYGTWNAFGNQYWPAKYLIDSSGNVRYVHFGEGDYDQTEDAISEPPGRGRPARIARRPGRRRDAPTRGCARPRPTSEPRGRRAGPTVRRRVAAARQPRLRRSPGSRRRRTAFAYSGSWDVSDESAEPRRRRAARRHVHGARRVFLVLGSPDREREVRVLLDGKPISAADAGADVARRHRHRRRPAPLRRSSTCPGPAPTR